MSNSSDARNTRKTLKGKERLRTAAKHWESYADLCVPKDASQVQTVATKNAFYAGMLVMFNDFAIIGEKDISEREGMAHMSAMRKELDAYFNKVYAAVLATARAMQTGESPHDPRTQSDPKPNPGSEV